MITSNGPLSGLVLSLHLQCALHKLRTVEVEFYRADLTDLPFCFGDTCFYLVSKFADLPMADMLKPGTQWMSTRFHFHNP